MDQPQKDQPRKRLGSTYIWPVENPLRGERYAELAKLFGYRYAPGVSLDTREFDEWCQEQDLYGIPATNDKKSDPWRAMVQRRHEVVKCLNLAASHSRMHDMPHGAYYIRALRNGWLKVQRPDEGVIEHELTSDLVRLLETKKRQMGYLLQGTDWGPTSEKNHIRFEEYYHSVEAFERVLKLQVTLLLEQHQRLLAHIPPQIREVQGEKG